MNDSNNTNLNDPVVRDLAALGQRLAGVRYAGSAWADAQARQAASRRRLRGWTATALCAAAAVAAVTLGWALTRSDRPAAPPSVVQSPASTAAPAAAADEVLLVVLPPLPGERNQVPTTLVLGPEFTGDF